MQVAEWLRFSDKCSYWVAVSKVWCSVQVAVRLKFNDKCSHWVIVCTDNVSNKILSINFLQRQNANTNKRQGRAEARM